MYFSPQTINPKSIQDSEFWGERHGASAGTLALPTGSAAILQRGLQGQPLLHVVKYSSAHLNVQRRATAAGKHRTGAIGRRVGTEDAMTAGEQTNMSASWHVFVRSLRKNFVKIRYGVDCKVHLYLTFWRRNYFFF